jgi:perosamine synthetase
MTLERKIPPVKSYFPSEDIQQIQTDVGVILRSGMLTLGAYVSKFEKRFAEECKVEHAIALNSGTSALEIALRYLRLTRDDEVLVPTNTFSATVASVIHAGGSPKLTDIDFESLCLDAANVERNLSRRTKAVIAVHIGGLICPEIKKIREICSDNGIFLIEDAAHAAGSTLDGQAAGSFGDVGCFSLYPTKVITSCEGGVITSNRDDVADFAKVLRDQGKAGPDSSDIVELGYNWRMSELSAAVGLAQVSRLKEIVSRRGKVATTYDGALNDLRGLRIQKIPDNVVDNFYKYVVFLSDQFDRNVVKSKLRDAGVRCGGEVYSPPCHLLSIYKKLMKTKEGDFPVAEKAARTMLCPPIYAEMTTDDVNYVATALRRVLY